jgi:hypothetical protein
VVDCIDNALSQFLYELQNSYKGSEISIYVNNKSVIDTEEHLQCLILSDEGWIGRFSKYCNEQGNIISRP